MDLDSPIEAFSWISIASKIVKLMNEEFLRGGFREVLLRIEYMKDYEIV